MTSIISVNDDIRHVTLPEIQVAENKYPETGYVCEYVYPELTALCPTSRLPDFYNITIAYEPDKRLPELKSLKYYFVAFRNVGTFHEHLINRIMDDFFEAVEPRWAYVQLFANNRGGITTTLRRYKSRSHGDEVSKALELSNVYPQSFISVENEEKSI